MLPALLTFGNQPGRSDETGSWANVRSVRRGNATRRTLLFGIPDCAWIDRRRRFGGTPIRQRPPGACGAQPARAATRGPGGRHAAPAPRPAARARAVLGAPAEVRPEDRREPRKPAPQSAVEPAAVDQSLAEMAQRLEAALRKPKAVDTRPPAA